jgi:hypothetical protein
MQVVQESDDRAVVGVEMTLTLSMEGESGSETSTSQVEVRTYEGEWRIYGSVAAQ